VVAINPTVFDIRGGICHEDVNTNMLPALPKRSATNLTKYEIEKEQGLDQNLFNRLVNSN